MSTRSSSTTHSQLLWVLAKGALRSTGSNLLPQVERVPTQKTWYVLSPMRNPVHLRLWVSSLFRIVTRNTKSEFYKTLVRPKVRVLWDRKFGSRPMGVSKMPSGISRNMLRQCCESPQQEAQVYVVDDCQQMYGF